MTIKIINHEPSKEVVKQVICRNCGVTLEYTPNDTVQKSVGDYGGGHDINKSINCPKCSKTINV